MGRYIKGMLCGLLVLVTFACKEEAEVIIQGKTLIQVVGRITEFNDHTVASRALKNEEESEIKTMSMFLFDNNGICVDFQHVTSSSPLFVIDRTILNDPSNDRDVSAATIYIMANIPLVHSTFELESAYWLGKEKNELLERSLSVSGIDVPTVGFPMIGSAVANLELDGDAKDLLEIPLKHLYAKMVVNIKVKTIQTLDDFISSFQMSGWEVHNVPKQVFFESNIPTESTLYQTEPFLMKNYTGNNPVSGANVLSFSFYVPEHLLQSDQDIVYPEGIGENEKQRFKPLRIKETTKAPFVRVKGVFNDHQGHRHNLTYDIYLGKDNWENFEIERNYQYNNNVTITGITNSTDGKEGTIAVDHRVNVERNSFIITMEREAMLDSHIEVRPIHIDIIEKEGVDQQVKLFLAEPSMLAQPISSDDADFKWARMEVAGSALNTTDYCSNGQRKYFTKTLFDELNNSGISAELASDNTVWMYFDENLNVSKTGTRKVILVAEYYENSTLVSSESYYFQQHDLFPVVYVDNQAGMEYRYDIEYYEEYLYHYDSDDGYSTTTEGMPWGPKEQISYEVLAIQDVQSWWADNLRYIEDAIKNAGGYYDFQNLYSGRNNTNKLITMMNQLVLGQDELPRSAAEHCYNKNKRQQSGEIEEEDFQWYLPAIGELQRIMSAAYTDFEMFQENRYWSSQTSYRIGHFNYRVLWGIFGTVEGDYYYEDLEYARATYAAYANGVYSYEPSEISGISKTWTGTVTNQTGSFSSEVAPASRDTGNRPRDSIHRVRAVRNKYQREIGVDTWERVEE